jgi:GH15 family glucan-1,4-alpha-glucosidase
LPGQAWRGRGRTVAWTPETAFFALAAASSGERTAAERWLGWLERHRTTLGALPEKVDEAGRPASVAPLAWTCSIVLLALTAQERTLPVPPAARAG